MVRCRTPGFRVDHGFLTLGDSAFLVHFIAEPIGQSVHFFGHALWITLA
jgi:hypothetical protein